MVQMMRIKIKIIITLLILIIVSGQVLAQIDYSGIKKLDFELKYSSFDTWRRVLDSDGDVIKDDDGRSYGVAVNYNISKKLFVQANYNRSDLYNVDLESRFNVGSFSSFIGRKFNVFEKVRFDLKTGFSILTYPLYETWVTTGTIDNEVVSRNVQRNFTRVSAFRFWSLGLAAAYPLSDELSIGGEVNWNYSISSGNGATISGFFLRMKLFD